MNGLERFHGHFYNWYDTHDLRPLEPRFISAVDSGNLAGHLIALGAACRQMMEAAPAPAVEWLAGIDDGLPDHAGIPAPARRRSAHAHGDAQHLEGALDALVRRRREPPRAHGEIGAAGTDAPRRHGRRYRAHAECGATRQRRRLAAAASATIGATSAIWICAPASLAVPVRRAAIGVDVNEPTHRDLDLVRAAPASTAERRHAPRVAHRAPGGLD